MRKQPKHKQGGHKLLGHVVDTFEIPEEVIANVPIISLVGHKEIAIENFKSILEYSDLLIRVSTNEGIVAIQGKGLEARSMTSEVIKIKGHIQGVMFEG